MKLNILSKLILLTGLTISAVFLFYSNAEAASFNYGPQDSPTLQVSNFTRNPNCNTCWTRSISANAGEIVSFMVYYHNTDGDIANDTTLRVSLPGGPFTSEIISGWVQSSNSSGANGSVNVYLSSRQSLTYIPGSFRWYPNQSSQSQGAPSGQNGSEIVYSGLNIGNIAGGWSSQGYAVFQAQVSSNNEPITTPSTPSYNYTYQTQYTPSYIPVYVPTYTQPTQVAPVPVQPIQVQPVQIAVNKPYVFQRSEDKLEFEIYLNKEKSLVNEENILFARYYNSGGSAAKNATLYLTLPDGVEFLKFTATPAIMREGNLFEYNIGTVAAGEEKIVSLNFLVGERVIPGTSLVFEGKLNYAGSKGTLKSIMDSTSLEITTANELTASMFSIFGPILNSWIRQILIGVIIGFLFCYFFYSKKKEPIKFK